MGQKYTSKTISGYNSSPPSDDGSVVDTNKTKWSHVKEKIGDSIKTLVESMNDSLVTHFDEGPLSISANTTLDLTHYNKTIEASTSITLTLTDANTLGAGWHTRIKNVGTVDVTIAPQTTADTLDGDVVASISLAQDEFIWIQVVNAGNGFIVYRASELATLLVDLNDGQVPVAGVGATSFSGWVPRNYISGLELSNNSTDSVNDIDVAVGEASDSTNGYVLKLTSGLTKQMNSPFAAGTDAGGMFNASKETSTTYFAFIIRNDSDGSIDAGFSTSVTATDIPSGYSINRRIGSVMTDDTNTIVEFRQNGNIFTLGSSVRDLFTTNPGTSGITAVLSVPIGVIVRAISTFSVTHDNAAGTTATHARITELAAPDYTTTATNYNYRSVNASGVGSLASSVIIEVLTNNVGEIRYRLSDSNANTAVYLSTNGWIDERI